MTTQNYIEQNKVRFLEELFDLLRIPSVSADPQYANDVKHAAKFVSQKFIEAGADLAEVIDTEGHPIVYAEKIIDSNLPTVLVYGHYDVQPPDPLDLWDSPAFEPVVKHTQLHPEGAIFARGSSDDKGQAYMYVKALEAMNNTDSLSCNLKFIIEGEEEVGSANLEPFIKSQKERLEADIVLISDSGIIANDVPSITTGLRGLSYVEVEVTSANRDLHSGIYGGAVANPINVLCEMIASLRDENKHITVNGFYDKVEIISDEERQEMGKIPFSEEDYKKELDLKDVEGEKGYSTIERTSIRPTLDVNGIWGGYTGEGSKTVIASQAFAKISMRLVPHQDPEEITELFTKHFESIAPPSVRVKVTPHHGAYPAVTPTSSAAYQAASKAMEESFGKKPLPYRGGGSIPIVPLFENVLGLKTVLMGFGLDSDAIHSPNEHFGLFNYYKGIETIPLFFNYFAELSRK